MPTGAPWVRATLPARSLEGEGLEGRGPGRRWNRPRGQAVPEAWSRSGRWCPEAGVDVGPSRRSPQVVFTHQG